MTTFICTMIFLCIVQGTASFGRLAKGGADTVDKWAALISGVALYLLAIWGFTVLP